jgi:Arc/MetJ family transcription regulator
MANVRRTSINLDFDLVERAKQALGTSGTTETVHKALEEVWRREAARQLAEWRFEIDDIEEFRRESWEHESYP